MKALVAGILAAFAVLLSVSVFVAEKSYDGTVERNYYRKSLDYFRDRERGAALAASGEPQRVAGDPDVLLDISPKPVLAMKDLTFSVEARCHEGNGRLWIDLGMEGMRMPPNRVNLEKDRDGRYRGKGILVRCPSGMRSWTATVHLPGNRKTVFSFDVAD
ncbi:MAG TPA: hypothetical protein VFF01_06745 [Candidatus Deferrimicrobiaceae bacterium]|nr:hypothetical protein [Candidatus Deferrimicrobiaceae bacterium]